MLLGRRLGGRKALPYVAAMLLEGSTSHEFGQVLKVELETAGSYTLVDSHLQFVLVLANLVIL